MQEFIAFEVEYDKELGGYAAYGKTAAGNRVFLGLRTHRSSEAAKEYIERNWLARTIVPKRTFIPTPYGLVETTGHETDYEKEETTHQPSADQK